MRRPAGGAVSVMAGTAVAALAVLALASPAAAAGDLVARWHLDGLVAGAAPDSSGNGLNALSGGEATPDVVPGRFGGALSFGSERFLRVTRAAALEPQNLTVVAWVKRDGPPGAARYLVAKGAQACTAASWALYTGGAADGLRFYVYDGNASLVTPPAGTAIWDDRWHAVAGTFDGTTVSLYVDGRLVGATRAKAPRAIAYGLASQNDLTIGNYPPGICGFPTVFDGAMDEVQVYRRALSAAEVGLLHGAPGPAPPVLPGDGGPGGGGGSGAGKLPPPAARVTTATSRTLAKGKWLSVAGTPLPAGVGMRSVEWDLDPRSGYEAPCGGAPAVSIAFRTPGAKSVKVRITDTLGRQATATQRFTVARDQANPASPKSGPVYDCENPGGDNQPDRTDCVKTFGFSVVSVNSKGGPQDCFRIEARARELMRPTASAAAAPNPRSRLSDYRWYRATIRGPVSLNGIHLPLPADLESVLDSGEGTIGFGKRVVRVGQFRVGEVDLSRKVEPVRGRWTLVDQSLSGNTPKFLGGLPIGGGVRVDLLTGGVSETRLRVKLPNVFTFGARGEPAQGEVTVRADNLNGVRFEGAQLGPISQLMLGPLEVDDLQLKYKREGEIWSGGATLGLAGLSPVRLKASPPPPDFGFGMRGGRFDHAGAGVEFPNPASRPVLFSGVWLKKIGVAIGVRPFRFTGIGGIAVGQVAEVDGALFMAFPTDAPYDFPEDGVGPELAPLAGRRLDTTTLAIGGTVKLNVPVKLPALGHAYSIYEYPDYFEFGGDFGFKHEYFSIDGGVGGFVALGAKKFNLEGRVQACLKEPVSICAPQQGAVVSSAGIALCTNVPLPTPFGIVPVPAGVGYRWGDKVPDVMVFTCDIGPYREARPSAARAAGAAGSFVLPGGLPAAMVRVRGRGGAPVVVLHGPRGERIAVSASSERTYARDFVVIRRPATGETLVALRRPAGGRWTVEAQPGSAPVASVASAEGRPQPRIRAGVARLGERRRLSYVLEGLEGRSVVFAERGARTYRVLGAARGVRGTLDFTPADGRAGRRRIVALLSDGGLLRRTLTVASFTAPGPRRPARPRRARVVRRGATIAVTWARAPRARRYAVVLALPRGERRFRLVRGLRATFRGVPRAARGSVRIRGLDAVGRAGREARASLPRARQARGRR